MIWDLPQLDETQSKTHMGRSLPICKMCRVTVPAHKSLWKTIHSLVTFITSSYLRTFSSVLQPRSHASTHLPWGFSGQLKAPSKTLCLSEQALLFAVYRSFRQLLKTLYVIYKPMLWKQNIWRFPCPGVLVDSVNEGEWGMLRIEREGSYQRGRTRSQVTKTGVLISIRFLVSAEKV